MPPWNLEETRDHVERRYGDTQLQVVRKCLQSIVDRQRYAAYHYYEYRRLLSEHIDEKLSSKSIYEITLTDDLNQEGELESCLTRVSANIIACVQSLHSLGDILSHVVYFALGINRGPDKLKERDVSLNTVTRIVTNTPSWADLANLLNGILLHQDFAYLRALVNHSKHRSIVGTVLSVDPPAEGKPPYDLLFDSFDYQDTQYQRRDVQPFLERTYAWLSPEIVKCGNALNRILCMSP